jgi:hypothetical protein
MKPTELFFDTDAGTNADIAATKALDQATVPGARILILGTGLMLTVVWITFLVWATSKFLDFA